MTWPASSTTWWRAPSDCRSPVGEGPGICTRLGERPREPESSGSQAPDRPTFVDGTATPSPVVLGRSTSWSGPSWPPRNSSSGGEPRLGGGVEPAVLGQLGRGPRPAQKVEPGGQDDPEVYWDLSPRPSSKPQHAAARGARARGPRGRPSRESGASGVGVGSVLATIGAAGPGGPTRLESCGRRWPALAQPNKVSASVVNPATGSAPAEVSNWTATWSAPASRCLVTPAATVSASP